MEQISNEVKAKSHESEKWICIQDMNNGRYWFVESTLAYTRKESIKLCLGKSSLTWRQCREKYGWRCSKVKVTIAAL